MFIKLDNGNRMLTDMRSRKSSILQRSN